MPSPIRRAILVALLAAPAAATGQTLTQRGFLDGQVQLYPQTPATPGDPHVVVQGLFRQEGTWRPFGWLALAGGVDARVDSHQRVANSWALDWDDRGGKRPRLSVRRASVTLRRGGLQFEAGKQLIRWGKADILNPTDRFAPRDFLDVIDNEVLPVTAARLLCERGADTIDLVVQPRPTPSRMPLLGQRWTVVRDAPAPFAVADGPTDFADRAAYGGRWNHAGAGIEYSLSVYDGFVDAPRVDVVPLSSRPVLLVARSYPGIRMIGGDLVKPTRWVTIRAEAAYFAGRGRRSDDFALYVLQVERQAGEWLLLGGYAGEVVRTRRGPADVAPDRRLARTLLGRASYTIDAVRHLAVEAAVRQSGAGAYLKSEYSRAAGAHWRVTLHAALLAGREDDFLGQFRRNNNVGISARYTY